MKTGKYYFERGIIALHFGENYASLPLLILEVLEEAWRTRFTSFISEHWRRQGGAAPQWPGKKDFLLKYRDFQRLSLALSRNIINSADKNSN